MDLNAFFDQAWVQVLLTIVGLIVGSAVALQWGNRNGYALGVRVGKWLPGDRVEQWLVEFLSGLREGLESTYTEATVVTTTDNPRPPKGLRADLKVQVLDNPFGGRPSSQS